MMNRQKIDQSIIFVLALTPNLEFVEYLLYIIIFQIQGCFLNKDLSLDEHSSVLVFH